MRVKLEEVCKRIYAGGDVPKDRYSEVKTKEYPIPIYANAEKDNGLYGYTDKAREEELSITVAARGTIGFTAIRREPFLPVVRLITVVPDTAKVSERYLYYVLKNCKPQSSGTSIPQLTVPDIKKNRLELYDISEQERIADQLDTVSKVIELRKQELEALDNLIKARFVEMFGECNNYELLGEADIFISDGNYSSKYPTADEFVTEGIPFIRASNMVNNTITDDEMYYISAEKHAELLKGHVKPNDVLIATRGAGIGKIAVVPEKHNDSNINAQIVLLRCNKDIYNPLYLSWYMKLQETQIKIQGLVSGSAQPQLPIKRLIQLTLLKPEIEMQNEFADFVHQVDKSKVVYMSIHKKLGKQKKQIKYKIA